MRRSIGTLAVAAAGAVWLFYHTGVDVIVPAGAAPETAVAARDLLLSAARSPNDWPGWRGARGDGVAEATRPPTDWSELQNVRWKVETFGRGHASPIVCGDAIYLASADETAEMQTLACHDRETGAERWRTVIHSGGFSKIHRKNSHASATPACDGDRVYTVFLRDGGLWISACDLSGAIVWQTKAGPCVMKHGYGSSPALFGTLVIVAGDNFGARIDRLRGSSFLAALDAHTGKIFWRVRRPQGDSYGIPVVANVAGRVQLFIAGEERICAYDPATGKELWHCHWSAARTGGSVAWNDDCVFASATYPEPQVVCVRADGTGDVTATHLVWRSTGLAADIPSPVCLGNRLFVVRDEGVAVCFDSQSGKTLGKRRIGEHISASPVVAAGCLYVVDEVGTTHFLAADESLTAVATNSDVSESVMASPVFSGNDLLLRTEKHLYRIGVDMPPQAAESRGATTNSGEE